MNNFKNKFISAGNDYSALLERTCGDEELIMTLMQLFLDDDSWNSMCRFMENGETENAFRSAHSLKGSSGMLGFTALFEKLKVITDKLRGGDLDGAKEVFDETKSAYEAAVELVKEFV